MNRTAMGNHIEMACYTFGNSGFMCGSFNDEHCFACGGFGEFLCDFPVGNEKSCDRPMCQKHAHVIAPDLDYCPSHAEEFWKFRESGGITKVLRYEVVPFATPEDRDR